MGLAAAGVELQPVRFACAHERVCVCVVIRLFFSTEFVFSDLSTKGDFNGLKHAPQNVSLIFLYLITPAARRDGS